MKEVGRPKGGSKYKTKKLIQFTIEEEEKEEWKTIAEKHNQTLADFIKEKVRIGLALEEIADLKLDYYAQKRKVKAEKDAIWFFNRILESPYLEEMFTDSVLDLFEEINEIYWESATKGVLEKGKTLIEQKLKELKKKQKPIQKEVQK